MKNGELVFYPFCHCIRAAFPCGRQPHEGGDDELDFIINYDIKYRMGKELEEVLAGIEAEKSEPGL